MSLKLIESFDGQRTYVDLKWQSRTSHAGSYVSAPTGQSGTWFQQPGNGTCLKWSDLNYSGDTLIVGWLVELPSVSPGSNNQAVGMFSEWDGSTQTHHAYIDFDAAGRPQLKRGQEGTVIATGSIPFPFGSGCRYLEMKAKIDNSAGLFILKIDEVEYMNVTGLDTQNGGTARCNQFMPMGQRAGGNAWAAKIRDVYICGSDGSVNNDFLGVVKTGVKTVTGAGASAQFTPSAGSNFQNVDDGTTVDGDTTYNSSTTVNHIDSFALSSSGLSAGTIKGTQSTIIARKDNVDPRAVAALIRSGGTNFPQTTQQLGPVFQVFREIQETDPNTSAAWTQANLDAMELGYKLIS